MKRYMKKPVIIEAERLTEEKHIETLEGTMKGNAGDWLIRGVEGELYPCKDEIFKKTYAPVGREEEGFNNPFFFVSVDMKTAYGELSLPSTSEKTVELILAFIIKGLVISMITSEISFGDIYQIVHTATNYGLTEAYQEAYDEEKKRNEADRPTD